MNEQKIDYFIEIKNNGHQYPEEISTPIFPPLYLFLIFITTVQMKHKSFMLFNLYILFISQTVRFYVYCLKMYT